MDSALTPLPGRPHSHAAPAGCGKDACPPLVLAIPAPDNGIRAAARKLVRKAAREALGALYGMPGSAVELISSPGQPLRAQGVLASVGLSVSHERGLSLLAINQAGPVGVDLLALDGHPDLLRDWEDVAHDYLDPDAQARIRRNPPPQRWPAFAAEWTRLEACLKCAGVALSEWEPAMKDLRTRCRIRALALPAGFVGALAWPT
jgi:4'-phosphopantetheinyl transferase